MKYIKYTLKNNSTPEETITLYLLEYWFEKVVPAFESAEAADTFLQKLIPLLYNKQIFKRQLSSEGFLLTFDQIVSQGQNDLDVYLRSQSLANDKPVRHFKANFNLNYVEQDQASLQLTSETVDLPDLRVDLREDKSKSTEREAVIMQQEEAYRQKSDASKARPRATTPVTVPVAEQEQKRPTVSHLLYQLRPGYLQHWPVKQMLADNLDEPWEGMVSLEQSLKKPYSGIKTLQFNPKVYPLRRDLKTKWLMETEHTVIQTNANLDSASQIVMHADSKHAEHEIKEQVETTLVSPQEFNEIVSQIVKNYNAKLKSAATGVLKQMSASWSALNPQYISQTLYARYLEKWQQGGLQEADFRSLSLPPEFAAYFMAAYPILRAEREWHKQMSKVSEDTPQTVENYLEELKSQNQMVAYEIQKYTAVLRQFNQFVDRLNDKVRAKHYQFLNELSELEKVERDIYRFQHGSEEELNSLKNRLTPDEFKLYTTVRESKTFTLASKAPGYQVQFNQLMEVFYSRLDYSNIDSWTNTFTSDETILECEQHVKDYRAKLQAILDVRDAELIIKGCAEDVRQYIQPAETAVTQLRHYLQTVEEKDVHADFETSLQRLQGHHAQLTQDLTSLSTCRTAADARALTEHSEATSKSVADESEKLAQLKIKKDYYDRIKQLCQETQTKLFTWGEIKNTQDEHQLKVVIAQLILLKELQAVLAKTPFWNQQVSDLRGPQVSYYDPKKKRHIPYYVPDGIGGMIKDMKNNNMTITEKLTKMLRITDERLRIKEGNKKPFMRRQATHDFYLLLNSLQLDPNNLGALQRVYDSMSTFVADAHAKKRKFFSFKKHHPKEEAKTTHQRGLPSRSRSSSDSKN